MTQHTFHMKNDLNGVDGVVLSMKTFVEKTLGPSSVFKLELSLFEALTNLVKHAKTSNQRSSIEISLLDTASAVIVDIFDPYGAQPFDLREHVQPLESVDPLAESGRGLGIILQCSDHVAYGLKADRMCLSLTFLKSGD